MDRKGIEPLTQVCKTRVFPLAPPAHFEIAVELNHDCPRLTIYPETISTSQKGIGIEPPQLFIPRTVIQTVYDVFFCAACRIRTYSPERRDLQSRVPL